MSLPASRYALVLLLSLGAVFGSSTALGATPTIVDVAGTVATGAPLTITGTTMMDEDRTNWDSTGGVNFKVGTASGFEGSGFVADGWSPGVSGSGSAASYDSMVKLSGNKSARMHIQGQHTATIDHNPRASFHNYYGASSQTEVWVRGYGRWDLSGGVWPREYIKMFWTNRNSGGYYVLQPQAGLSGDARPSHFLLADGWDTQNGAIPSGQLQLGRWYCLELHVKDEVGGTRVTAWVDGTQIAEIFPAEGDLDMQWFEFGVINLDGTDASFVLDHYWDNVAMSLTDRIYPASLIEIANGSDYATATKKYQEPLFLSDGSIQIKADLTGLGAGPYYLFVTNNRQERSTAYLLGEADTTAPVAPTGLAAQ